MQQTPNDFFNFVEEPLNIKVGDVSTVWKLCHDNCYIEIILFVLLIFCLLSKMNTTEMESEDDGIYKIK